MATYKIIDLSTAYLTENDANLLNEHVLHNSERFSSDPLLLFSKYGAGYIMRVPEDDMLEEELDDMRKHGFNEAGLIAVMKYAHNNDACMLRFDRDGDESIEELTLHNW